MGKIKKISEKESANSAQRIDVYPVTSTKAVYNENNVRLDDILKPATKESAGLMSPEDKNNIELVQTEMAGKVDKASVVQESGDAEDKIMSQKAVSDKFSDLSERLEFKTEGIASSYIDMKKESSGYYSFSSLEIGSIPKISVLESSIWTHKKIAILKGTNIKYKLITNNDVAKIVLVRILDGSIAKIINDDTSLYTADEDYFAYINTRPIYDVYVEISSAGVISDIEKLTSNFDRIKSIVDKRFYVLSFDFKDLFTIKKQRYDISSGELTTDNAWGIYSTEKIKLPYIASECRFIILKYLGLQAFVFFDADEKFICNAAYDEEFQIPRNAAYFAVSVQDTGYIEAIFLHESVDHYDGRKILIPSTIYSLNGKELTLYKKPICKSLLSFNFLPQNLEYARITPTKNITCDAVSYCDGTGKLKKKVSINVCNGVSGNSIKVCALGDSITQMQKYVIQAHNLLENVEFVASSGSMEGVDVEGRGGWTMGSYFNTDTKGTTGYGGGTNSLNPFIQPKKDGHYYGSTAATAKFILKDKKVASIGFESNGLKSSPKIGDIMYDDNSSVSSTPGYVMYDGEKWTRKDISPKTDFAFSIEKYISAWNADFDIISVLLGTNGYAKLQVYKGINTSEFITNMNTIIEQVKALNKKIIVMLPTPIVILDDTSNFCSRLCEGYVKLREDLIYNYDGRQSEGIYICDFGGAIDPIYGYSWPIEEKPFEEYTLEDDRSWGQNTPTPSVERKRIVTPNDVHPTYNGAKQGGTRYAGTIQWIRENSDLSER